MLGASLEEQVAGLLHDVSHPAFSHIYDWAIEDPVGKLVRAEDGQDKRHQAFIKSSELPEIISDHGFSVERISDHFSFRLLEQPAPDICADRIDYSLREMPDFFAKNIAQGLVNYQGYVICGDFETARTFAWRYLMLQRYHWGGYEAVARYFIFSRALRRALKVEALTIDDFWSDDQSVLKKVLKRGDAKVKGLLELLEEKPLKPPRSGVRVGKKFRHIDPKFLKENELKRLSEDDEVFKKDLEEARLNNSQGVLVPDVDSVFSL